ncbi:MAG: sel1 repeat family protein [Bacilli bacterium]|nr:sel1 repeat family protein [Bacilli bacterium]
MDIVIDSVESFKQYIYEKHCWYQKVSYVGEVAKDIYQYGLNDDELILAVCLYRGIGVEKDYVKALALLKKHEDNSLACLLLGFIYKNGYGIEKENEVAANYFRKCAEMNNPEGKTQLGRCYLFGQGVEINREKAYRLFLEASNDDYANANFYLGFMYHGGYYVKKDLDKAKEYYELVLKDDDSVSAAYNLALVYDNKKDYTNAFHYFLLGANANYNESYFALGNYYYYGHGVEIDYLKAKECFDKYAELSKTQEARGYIPRIVNETLDCSLLNLTIDKVTFKKKKMTYHPLLDEKNKKIYAGLYPQSRVKDEKTITKLNSLAKNSENLGENNCYTYKGEQYRKVECSPIDEQFFADGEPVREGLYWFKADPIEWNILKKLDDNTYVVYAEKIISVMNYLENCMNYNLDYRLNFSESKLRTKLNASIEKFFPGDMSLCLGTMRVKDKPAKLNILDDHTVFELFNRSFARDELKAAKASDYIVGLLSPRFLSAYIDNKGNMAYWINHFRELNSYWGVGYIDSDGSIKLSDTFRELGLRLAAIIRIK